MGGGNVRFLAASNVFASLIAINRDTAPERVAFVLKGMLIMFIALRCGAAFLGLLGRLGAIPVRRRRPKARTRSVGEKQRVVTGR
jgi:hypothetical protein